MTARRLLVGLVLSLCVSMWTLAGSAFAGVTHPLVSSFGSGSLSFAQSIAIDQAGDVYVYDAKGGGTIHKYDSTGAPVNFSSTGTNEVEGVGFNGGGGEEQIAVDHSSATTKGDIYVASGSRVGVYAATGASLGELNGGVESEVPSTMGTWGQPCGVAVDATGHVYVGLTSGHVFKYTPSANPVVNTDYTAALSGLEATCNIAVDSAGNIYTDTFPSGPVHKYDPLQFGLYLATGTVVSEQGSTIGLDPSDDLYVDQGSQVVEYSPGGEQVSNSTGGEASFGNSYGVVATAGTVYVADNSRGRIDVLGPAVTVADVVLGEAVGMSTTAEALYGTVDPSGVPVTVCKFEYGTSASGAFSGSAPCSPSPGSGSGAVEVSSSATGLLPNTAYQLRLVAENANGKTVSQAGGFTTPSTPLIQSESPREVAYEGATIEAQIAPMGPSATYHVEYGTDASYGSRAPVSEAPVGSGSESLTVKQSLYNLQAGATYHFRVVASNAYGTTDGSDHVLRTPAAQSAAADSCPNAAIRSQQRSASLPECRAYEMVSPVQKGGGNIAALPGRTESAADGNSIQFFSKTAFGDAIGSEMPGAEYIAERGTEGWLTHSINPAQRSGFFTTGAPSRYIGLSPDLTKGVFYARSPVLPGHPNVEGLQNLYLRSDLQAGGAGSYELLSEAFAPLETPKGESVDRPTINFDWASADWSRIIFDTYSNLTPETSALDPSHPKVYEWHDGTVTFVGVLPDSACVSPPCLASESVGGDGGGIGQPAGGPNGPSFEEAWTMNSISADGSRIVFEADPLTTEAVVFTNSSFTFGRLYMRINGATTIQLNKSERTTPDPRGDQPARFLAATPDDSKVFFETDEALTNDSEMPDNNLYMYDTEAPAGKHLTLVSVDHEPSDGGYRRVETAPSPATNEDGSFVYFYSQQKLIAGQPNPIPNENGFQRALYVWHGGTIRLITYHIGQGFEPEWGEGSVREANSPVRGADEFRMSADGRKVAFASFNPNTAQRAGVPADVARTRQVEIYVYDYDTDTLTCASCDPGGALPTSSAGFETKADGILANSTKYLSNAMSRDGRYVFFDTGDPLVAQDANGRRDVYEYDTVTGEVHLLSGGTCACDATFAEASPDGSNAFFTTRQRLVRADIDNNTDLYDVRVDGGIAAQNDAPPAACAGEECRGPAVSAPGFSVPSSASFAGAGNPGAPLAKVVVRRKRPTLAQALRACKRKPRKQRARCRARARKAHHANRATVQASRRAGR
ncbi:MAG TPA: NHL repeat-containing protein [Solirubrobacteraceae bacterium]